MKIEDSKWFSINVRVTLNENTQVHVSDLSVDRCCANKMSDDQCTSKMKSLGNKVVLEVGPRVELKKVNQIKMG